MSRDCAQYRFLPMVVFSVCLAFTAGCVVQPGGVAPSTVPVNPGGYTVFKEVEGEACASYLFGIIPVSNDNRLKDAIDDALDSAKGADALIKVTVDHSWQSMILWATSCTKVHGIAVQIRTPPE